MDRPHIITLSGKPGSGKSSTSDKVAELLGYTHYSSGDFVREVSKQRGLSLSEFNERAAHDHTLDEAIDERLRKLRNDHNIVIDARLGFYWIPESFKVYLDLNIDVAAARIFKDTVSNVKRGVEAATESTISQVQAGVKRRQQSEKNRFRSIYGVDPFDTSHFDLVVDTSRHSPQTVALAIFDNYKKWLKSDEWERVVEKVPLGYSLKSDY